MSDNNQTLPDLMDLPDVSSDLNPQPNSVNPLSTQISLDATNQVANPVAGSASTNPLQQVAVPQQIVSTQQTSGQNTPQTSGPAIADDIDLIEKEWVVKAKEVVDKTKDNPYLQNKAISEMKADYIKKRYNKDLDKSD